MKNLQLLLLLLSVVSLPGCINAQTLTANDQIAITISQLTDTFVTDAVKKMEKDETLDIKREKGKITATTYFHLLDCGNYTASAKVKNDSIIITVNNSKICDGNSKYYKLEAVIDDPKNVPYKITVDPAFTFLAEGERIETFIDEYPVGDVDGDKKPDTAIVEYEKAIAADGSPQNDCGKGVCNVRISFGRKIEPIVFEGMSVVLAQTIDVNKDGANEVLVYRWWYECCWTTLDLYSYRSGTWNIIATSKAFITWDDNDFRDRVKMENGHYYLMGQKWNDDISEIITDKVHIK
ncbi:hypothetical protein [Flavobacterium sp.]|uniref:hypothetical protein n=1 Tax=Flavobacterium sp. TaxID=239 RepID=UPI00403492E1